jgi:hypothetical protein
VTTLTTAAVIAECFDRLDQLPDMFGHEGRVINYFAATGFEIGGAL